MAARSRKKDGVPAIEWVTGVCGLAIVLGTIGFIAYEAFRGTPGEPRLEVAIETSRATASGFSVTVLVRNASRRAAADVVVEGILRSRDTGVQTSEVRLDYVPGLSTRRATLVFQAPAAENDVSVRIVGYTTP
jgi:uncharacterized protein (TIGR02588 family)